MYALRSKSVFVDGKFIPADLLIEGSIIIEVSKYGFYDKVIDFENRKILPGIVDLHCDGIEKEIEPRPGASFPLDMAIIEFDKKLALQGVTTIFHGISFKDEELQKVRTNEYAREIVERIHFMQNNNTTLVDNFIHLRFEITNHQGIPLIKELIADKKINILSIMDHSPGQGQFKTLESWKKYHLNTYDLKESEIGKYLKEKFSRRKMGYVEELTKFAKDYGIVLLSHDDDCKEKLNTLRALGVSISEFPLSLDVAKDAKDMGMGVGMGAPNVVRGGSQSGNIAARLLIEEGVCDYLCSDYHPSSMLLSPYKLRDEINLPIEKGFEMITSIPAKLIGLNDRGTISKAKLADIIVVDESFYPRVVFTVKKGNIIYNSYDLKSTYKKIFSIT